MEGISTQKSRLQQRQSDLPTSDEQSVSALWNDGCKHTDPRHADSSSVQA